MDLFLFDGYLLFWQTFMFVHLILFAVGLVHIIKRVSYYKNWLEGLLSLVLILIPVIGPIAYLIGKRQLKPLA